MIIREIPQSVRENATLPNFEHISLLVHQGAGSGLGGRAAPEVERCIRAQFPRAILEVVNSRSREHIRAFCDTCKSQLLVCLSGDGSVHDAAQSLMARPASTRPALAVIPAGSGNDYARTLGSALDPVAAAHRLGEGTLIKADVGRVNSSYFLETLSFGVDAAVALGTEDLRLATKTRGVRLYARAAINAILHEFTAHHVRMAINGGERTLELNALICAIQNGPTYGSGFRVAPQASITDGLLDIYCAHGISKPAALYYLARIKNGKHENLKGFLSFKAQSLDIELAEDVPIQCDGERLTGRNFNIELLHQALEVVVAAPQHCAKEPADV